MVLPLILLKAIGTAAMLTVITITTTTSCLGIESNVTYVGQRSHQQ
jgi:hypothetical protein